MPEATAIEFPCRFPIKAMGEDSDDFEQLVVSLVTAYLPPDASPQVHRRTSRQGRYVSVTVVIEATSKTQLDDIYRQLSAHERVLMAL